MKGSAIWIVLQAAANWWKFPRMSFGETKESNDAKLRALQMKGKGKRNHQRYKRPKGR